jgi:putative flavoprotein involved in K+ transport
MNTKSDLEERNRPATAGSEYFETVIIGGGQAGLSVGYHLKKQGRPFVILDANERIGDAWRKRWDSLRLFTPARYDGLAGWRFPAPAVSFPTKDEMADYLESYAAWFDLPVRTGVKVDGLSRQAYRYVLTAGSRRFEAEHVVVATGANQVPKVPAFADDLHPSIVQLHSSHYCNPSQLQEGAVLVVGAGNSGAEIAFEVSRTHPTYLSGKPSGQLPVRHGLAMARFVFPVIRFVGNHVLTLRTPIGRKVQPRYISHGAPLIRVKLKDLAAAGVEQVPRTVGVEGGRPMLKDGRVLDVSNSPSSMKTNNPCTNVALWSESLACTSWDCPSSTQRGPMSSPASGGTRSTSRSTSRRACRTADPRRTHWPKHAALRHLIARGPESPSRSSHELEPAQVF